MSGSSRTKHIKHRYYLVKDKIAHGDLEIAHMGTDKMWSDILNKPKQGKAFRVFRSHVMNCSEDYDDDVERIKTHPLLLPAEDTGTNLSMSKEDKAVINKAIAPAAVDKNLKGILRNKDTMIKQSKKMLNHRRSVLGEHAVRVRALKSDPAGTRIKARRKDLARLDPAGTTIQARRKDLARLSRTVGYRKHLTDIKNKIARRQ